MMFFEKNKERELYKGLIADLKNPKLWDRHQYFDDTFIHRPTGWRFHTRLSRQDTPKRAVFAFHAPSGCKMVTTGILGMWHETFTDAVGKFVKRWEKAWHN